MSASYYFHFIDHKCNVTLSAQGDTLQSPNYPANYPNGVICHTLIEAPKTLVVWLNIVNFSLQSDGSEQGICTNDYDTLTFYDGPNESAPFLGEYCGSLIPETFQSSGIHLFVVFKSNHNQQRIQDTKQPFLLKVNESVFLFLSCIVLMNSILSRAK